MMNYSIVSGSPRINSQSAKVANYIQYYLIAKNLASHVYIHDLAKTPLPLWDESFLSNRESWNTNWTLFSQQLLEADGLIIIVPEWDGMVPSCLKNFFQLCNNGELAHKPALIVSVSSMTNGAYPIAELRMSSYKNSKICYLPEHVIIKNVNDVLNDHNDSHNKDDSKIRDRLAYSIELLSLYADAFKKLRQHHVIKSSKYLYGM